ncbi:MAG TPA: hypothetical protein V6C57_04180, partial [Coleofasciculaceae cyanobacterium]
MSPPSSSSLDWRQSYRRTHFLVAMSYRRLISPETQFYDLSEPFFLESGQVLLGVQIAYRTWGQLNASRDNAIWIC